MLRSVVPFFSKKAAALRIFIGWRIVCGNPRGISLSIYGFFFLNFFFFCNGNICVSLYLHSCVLGRKLGF
jgi:hypothetical protein